MFDEARQDLTDALSAKERPLTIDEARSAVDGGDLVAESAINQFGEKAEQAGTEYLVGIESGPSYDLGPNSADEDADDADDAEGADGDAKSEEETEVSSTTDFSATAQRDAAPGSWESDGEQDLYKVGPLTVTHNPEDELVGEPTGDDWHGIPKLTNGHDQIPNVTHDYWPVEIEPGNRTSVEWMGRVIGDMNRPLLFEGEAGTGKNTAFAWMAHQTNRPTQRINFGTDVSVFDLVGEKEIQDGSTYYILGDLARAALFGHFCIWDEVNMVTGSTSSFLHGVAEKPGNRSLEIRGTEVTLTDIPVTDDEIQRYGSWYEAARAKWTAEEHLGRYIHPEFRIGATCNPLDYADTENMNEAFRDRFVTVDHPFLDAEAEAQLLAATKGGSKSDYMRLVQVAHILREARSQANAHGTPIGFRPLEKVVEAAGPNEGFMSFRDAAMTVLVEQAATKADKQYIRETIEDEL